MRRLHRSFGKTRIKTRWFSKKKIESVDLRKRKMFDARFSIPVIPNNGKINNFAGRMAREGKLKKMVQTCCMPPTDASLFASSSRSPLLLSYLPTEIFPPVSFRNNSEFSEKDLHHDSPFSPQVIVPAPFFFHRHIFLRYLALKKRKEPRLPFTSSSSSGGEGKFFILLSALLHFSFFSSPLLLFLLRNLLLASRSTFPL